MIVLAEFNCNCSFVCSGYQKREKVVGDCVYGKMLQVVKEEGWERLYGGLMPSVVGTAASQVSSFQHVFCDLGFFFFFLQLTLLVHFIIKHPVVIALFLDVFHLIVELVGKLKCWNARFVLWMSQSTHVFSPIPPPNTSMFYTVQETVIDRDFGHDIKIFGHSTITTVAISATFAAIPVMSRIETKL